MKVAVWLYEFERAAAEVQRAMERVTRLASFKRVPDDDFALQLVVRAQEYLKKQLAFGKAATDRLSEGTLPKGERPRILRELSAAAKRMRRVALYVHSQVFRLDEIDQLAAGAEEKSLPSEGGDADRPPSKSGL